MTSTVGKPNQAGNMKLLLLQNHIFFKLVSFLKDSLAWSQQLLHYRISNLSSGTLEVIDHRTGNHHRMKVSNNAVQALDLQAVNAGTGYDVADRMKSGLRVLDPGFQNTAVMKSEITFV